MEGNSDVEKRRKEVTRSVDGAHLLKKRGTEEKSAGAPPVAVKSKDHRGERIFLRGGGGKREGLGERGWGNATSA